MSSPGGHLSKTARDVRAKTPTSGRVSSSTTRRSLGSTTVTPTSRRESLIRPPSGSSLTRTASPATHLRRRSSGAIPGGVVAGARVYLSTKRIYGTVRFIGFVNGKEGVWAGIELEQAVGMNNGIVEGTRYFECAPFHGVFVKPETCVLVGDERDGGDVDYQNLGSTAHERTRSRGEEGIRFRTPSPKVERQESRHRLQSSRDWQSSFASPPPVAPLPDPVLPVPLDLPEARHTARDAKAPAPPAQQQQQQQHLLSMEDQWLVDMLVEMVAESSLVQAKVGEHVKQQVGDDLLRKMEGFEYRLEGCEGEMQGLGQAISARFKKLEDKIDSALVGAGSGASGAELTGALQMIAQAAREAKEQLTVEIDRKAANIREMRALVS